MTQGSPLLRLVPRTDDDWWSQAACHGMDTELFYRGDTYSSGAQRVCRSCPVQVECLEDVLVWEQQEHRYGVFGGLTAADRRALFRRLGHRSAAAVAAAAARG